MYKVFLHISSITILEICFFFYYIGPLETELFLNYIKKIIEGANNLDNILNKWNLSKQQFIDDIYDIENESNTDVKNQLYLDSKQGKHERMLENEYLFNQTLEYWGFIAAFTIILIGVEQIYKNMQDKQLRYRKNSIDDEDDEYTIDTINIEEKKTKYKQLQKCCKVTFKYIIFGSSIVTFQYLFFQYVVFEYTPLSIEEIKYYVYCNLLNE